MAQGSASVACIFVREAQKPIAHHADEWHGWKWQMLVDGRRATEGIVIVKTEVAWRQARHIGTNLYAATGIRP